MTRTEIDAPTIKPRWEESGQLDPSRPGLRFSVGYCLLIHPNGMSRLKMRARIIKMGRCSTEAGLGMKMKEEEEEEETKKKRKKRAKKKRPDPSSACGGAGEHDRKKDNKKEELVCLYPFTTSSSAVQRKLKQNYDQLAKSHESNALTLAQVGQFVNCLVEAKKELKHRSEVIQRKFTITKALLLKADRSSFDRLHQQIYKLELEQRRLEEDAVVYNWLQQQLKVSSAYKKLLEIGARMEAEDKHREQVERTDDEFADISFEELLAQEKKDAFWQRNGKSRSCSISGQRFC
ncbi:uncharacterized protein [Coffea arabica]|uniref:Uncharacterized protein n=1 Tax=Coffea arabica TaxID=13443 RepID=A0ABM4U259_COFAR